jgi:hypothetical protein
VSVDSELLGYLVLTATGAAELSSALAVVAAKERHAPARYDVPARCAIEMSCADAAAVDKRAVPIKSLE